MLIYSISYLSRISISQILLAGKMQLRTVHCKYVEVTELKTTIRLTAYSHLIQIRKRKLGNVYSASNSLQLFYHDNCAFLSLENG